MLTLLLNKEIFDFLYDNDIRNELMPINKEIRKMISQSASDVDIEEAAVRAGMKTLQQYCLKHIIAGETPISEFVRVLGVVSE